MPVLPAVPSTTVPPGLSAPRFSASRIRYRPARSLTEPPGLRNSALPRISQPVSLEGPCRRMSGVFPMLPMKPSRISTAEELMPVYIIAQVNVTDPAKYQEYAKLAGPANAKYGGKFIVRGGAKTTLEGDIPFQRIVI